MKIGCRALAFHIFKNFRLFYKKNVAGLVSDVVRNPEYKFSRDEAHIISFDRKID